METRICYENKYFKVEEMMVDNKVEPFYKLKINNSVVVCVLDSSDSLWFVKQYRPSLGYKTIEMVAGEIESGETPQEAAERELKEELGMKGEMIQVGGPQRMMMNRTDNEYYFFLAIRCERIKGQTMEENIEAIKMKRQEFRQCIKLNRYEHMAGIALIGLIKIDMGVDILNSTLDNILEIFEVRKIQ